MVQWKIILEPIWAAVNVDIHNGVASAARTLLLEQNSSQGRRLQMAPDNQENVKDVAHLYRSRQGHLPICTCPKTYV